MSLSPKFTIPIPPFSANQMYRNVQSKGRVRTTKYNDWRNLLLMLLPHLDINPELPLTIRIVFGTFYYKQFDLDNMVKPLIDGMQIKWRFNDNIITRYEMEKRPAKRGEEYIEFNVIQDGP